MNKTILALILFLTTSTSALAGIAGYSGTVTYVGTDWNYSRFLISLSGTGGYCQFGQFSIDGSNPNYKESVALIMIAYSNGKSINLTTDGSCPNNRANVIGVNLNQ